MLSSDDAAVSTFHLLRSGQDGFYLRLQAATHSVELKKLRLLRIAIEVDDTPNRRTATLRLPQAPITLTQTITPVACLGFGGGSIDSAH